MSGDPVSVKSPFLRMYMSHHPDTLVAYAKWYGKVQAPIVSAELTDINTKARSTPPVVTYQLRAKDRA